MMSNTGSSPVRASIHYEGGKVPAYGSESKLIVGSAPGNRAGSIIQSLNYKKNGRKVQ